MGDYPDYTDIMQILGSDIQVPIDIQGAYIQMPVDIQAQYANLDIDIVAQTVGNIAINVAAQTLDKLNINLAASAITLNVNIKTITAGVTFNIGNVEGPFNIKIGTAQTVGVYLQPDWQVKAGKRWFKVRINAGFTSDTVGAGETLYITALTFSIWADTPEDMDLNQMGEARLYDQTAGEDLACVGGNGGGAVTFPAPVRVDANHEIRLYLANNTNHTVGGRAVALGYLV